MSPCYEPVAQRCCGSENGGAATNVALGVPAGEELTDGFEGLRLAFGVALGCKEVDEADGDDAGWTGGRERPPMTAGPYAFQRLKAESMVKPPAAVPPGC
jgi:hypothetical protein